MPSKRGISAPALAWMAGISHSNLSYLNTVAPVCIISSKLRVGINTPFFSCGQEYLHLPVVYGMVYVFLPADYGMV